MPAPSIITWDSAGPDFVWDSPTLTWDAPAPNQTTSMAHQDLAQIRATQAWIDELNTLLTAVITHLEEKTVSLTPEQKQKFQSIGPESADMVDNGVALIRDNPGWFALSFNRAELLLDVTDRNLWLQPKSHVLKIKELWEDTLHAVSADILKAIRNARPFIEQSAELTGSSNDQVREFLAYFKRFGPQPPDEEPETPELPPGP